MTLLFTSRVASKPALDLSDVPMSPILLAQSKTSPFFGVTLKCLSKNNRRHSVKLFFVIYNPVLVLLLVFDF